MNNTQAADLLADAEFCALARLSVPAKNLVKQYCPDRSVRWLQEVQKTARETPAIVNEDRYQFKGFCSDVQYQAIDVAKTVDFWVPVAKPKRIPESTTPIETNWWKLDGNFAVVSDCHVPFHCASTLERLMDDAETAGVKDLIIAGDLLDGNQFNFRRGKQHQRKAQDDIEEARGVLVGLLKWFDTIKVIQGNHDMWLADYLRSHFDADFLYSSFFKELSPRVKWSKYGHCDVVSGGVKWKITHGANFSETSPVGIAKKLADKFGCNILMGHQHRVEESFGKYHCICMGGSLDSRKMAYLQHHPTTNAEAKQSYAILKDGWCQHVIVR